MSGKGNVRRASSVPTLLNAAVSTDENVDVFSTARRNSLSPHVLNRKLSLPEKIANFSLKNVNKRRGSFTDKQLKLNSARDKISSSSLTDEQSNKGKSDFYVPGEYSEAAKSPGSLREEIRELKSVIEEQDGVADQFFTDEIFLFDGIYSLLPQTLADLNDTNSWKTIYSLHDVQSCISKVQPLDYCEQVDIYGILQIAPLSSGFCIGSCNWLLQTKSRKICYVSASSVFATHPQPMDQSGIKDCDFMIMNSLTEAPTVNPDGMLRDFCNHLSVTLKNGGNVLIPSYPSGVIYDLFEYLVSFLDGSGLSFVPIYFVSPVAKSSLAYANIYAEWLCQSKLSKVYLPESPFTHAELVKSGRLKHFTSLHAGLSSNFRTPCIVFAGHPSLRFGDATHFIEMWGNSSANTVIFIEPDFPYLEALSPFQPLLMKAIYRPIDPRLNFTQANKLIKDLKPKEVLIPERYTKPPEFQPYRNDLSISVDCKLTTYKQLDTIDRSLPSKFENVSLSNELCAELCPKEVETGVAISSLSGLLVTRDNKKTIHSFTSRKSYGVSTGSMLFGDVAVERLVDALEENGIHGAQWDTQEDGGYIISMPGTDTVIQLNDGNTHIINPGGDELRIKIRDVLLSSLLQV
eukprot:gene7283-8094_t